MYMRQDIKTKAIRRLKITEGQIRGLQKMVEDEKYCIDIITQVSAIKEAPKRTGLHSQLNGVPIDTSIFYNTNNLNPKSLSLS